jgi:hypothetical protein
MKNLYISIIITVLCFWLIGCFTSTRNNLDDYNTRLKELSCPQQVMPALGDLPPYEKIYYQYRRTTIFPLLFYAQTMLLVVTYNEETYQIETSKIHNYHYLDEAVFSIGTVGASKDNVFYKLPEPEFQINSFNFRVLEANQTNDFLYPHYMGIIAASDEKNSIAYLYYDDQDLDYISKDKTEGAMVNFVKKYFKYRW